MPSPKAIGLGLDLEDIGAHSCTLSVSSSSDGSTSSSQALCSPMASPWQSACPSPIVGPSTPTLLLSPIPQSPAVVPYASTSSVLSKLKRRRKPAPIPLPCTASAASMIRLKSGNKRGRRDKRPSLRILLLLLGATLALISFFSSRSWYKMRIRVQQNEHASSALPADLSDAVRDTLVLYRIIGNDLPPRHAPNQTLSNLRFLLQHESDFTSTTTPSIGQTEKYFVLNRIVSETLLGRVKALLQEFHVRSERILEIPFEWEEYEQRQMRWDSAVADATELWGVGRPPGVLEDENALQAQQLSNQTFAAIEATERLPDQKGKRRKRVQNIGKLRAIDYTFHDKNLYAINNNGGRNFALAHGRSLPHARWILPLDGNCFFTPPAMSALLGSLHSAGEGESEKRHVVIPMARLLDNEAIKPNNTIDFDASTAGQFAPKAPDEPQVGFRFDSDETFQPAMRYGRRSKLEFLWRLGAVARSRNLDRRTLPWEQSDRDFLTAETFASIKTQVKDVYSTAGYIEAGWVFRLFSGNGNQEHHTPEASSLRNMNRIRGIISHLERLDERLARGKLCGGEARCGFEQALTWSWEWEKLQDFRAEVQDGEDEAKDRFAVLKREAVDLVAAAHSPRKVAVDLDKAAQHASTLALTGYLSNDHYWTDQAARIVEARFMPAPMQVQAWLHSSKHTQAIDGEGYIFPMVTAVDVVPPLWSDLVKHQTATKDKIQLGLPYDPRRLDPTPLLDALRLLSLSPGMTDRIPAMSMHALFSAHLAWLVSDPQKLAEAEHPASEEQALEYDLQVTALAAFVDDVRLVARVAQRAQIRSPAHELHPTLSAHLAHIRMLPTWQTSPLDQQLE